jgi:hypothetical protein
VNTLTAVDNHTHTLSRYADRLGVVVGFEETEVVFSAISFLPCALLRTQEFRLTSSSSSMVFPPSSPIPRRDKELEAEVGTWDANAKACRYHLPSCECSGLTKIIKNIPLFPSQPPFATL